MFTTADSTALPKKRVFSFSWATNIENSIFITVENDVLHTYVILKRGECVDLNYFLNIFNNLTFSTIFDLRV